MLAGCFCAYKTQDLDWLLLFLQLSSLYKKEDNTQVKYIFVLTSLITAGILWLQGWTPFPPTFKKIKEACSKQSVMVLGLSMTASECYMIVYQILS